MDTQRSAVVKDGDGRSVRERDGVTEEQRKRKCRYLGSRNSQE